MAALEERQAQLESLRLEGRGKVSGPQGVVGGEISLVAARGGLLRLETYGPFGQPALFVVAQGNELWAVNFSERRYYVGLATSPRLAAFLPLGLRPEELFPLLSAAPIPAKPGAYRSLPPGEAPGLQRAAKTRGRAVLITDGAWPAQLLFGDRFELLAASFGPPDCQLVALYSDWRRLDGGSFPFRLEFRLPEVGRGLRLEVSEAELNPPLAASTFVLGPPPGFATIRVP